MFWKILGAAMALVAVASQPASADSAPREIAILSNNVAIGNGSVVAERLEAGLASRGYEPGSIAWIRRPADRNHDMLKRYAAELVRMKPDLIVAGDTTSARALKAAESAAGPSGGVPVVFWSLDPVGAGLAESYRKPGGMFTGTADAANTQARELQFLKAVVPGLRRVGMLYNPTYAPAPAALRGFRQAAHHMGLDVTPYETLSVAKLGPSIEKMKADGMGAMVVGPHHLFNMNGEAIGHLAARNRLPAISVVGSVLKGGGVAVFGPDFRRIWFDQAEIVDRILQGEKPADIRIKRPPAAFRINLKAARRMGLSVPPEWLAGAREVIR